MKNLVKWTVRAVVVAGATELYRRNRKLVQLNTELITGMMSVAETIRATTPARAVRAVGGN